MPTGRMDAVPESCTADRVEQELTFVGLLGMIDPPEAGGQGGGKGRPGAGLKSVMVTGDYKDTAEAVARDIGLLTAQWKGLQRRRTGQDERMRIWPR